MKKFTSSFDLKGVEGDRVVSESVLLPAHLGTVVDWHYAIEPFVQGPVTFNVFDRSVCGTEDESGCWVRQIARYKVVIVDPDKAPMDCLLAIFHSQPKSTVLIDVRSSLKHIYHAMATARGVRYMRVGLEQEPSMAPVNLTLATQLVAMALGVSRHDRFLTFMPWEQTNNQVLIL
jgi:hypothetical protein